MTQLDRIFEACEPVDGLYRHPLSGLMLRNRSDAWLMMTLEKDYGGCRKFDYDADAVALDLGAAVGTFTWFALSELKLGRVVAVEPLPEHLAVFHANHDRDLRIDLFEAAVRPTDEGRISFFIGKNYTHGSSVAAFRGRSTVTVDSIAFDRLLEYEPALIKCDIEGSEYDLDWSRLPESVTEVVAELHQHRAEWIAAGAVMDAQLLALGFRHVRAPRHIRVYNGMQTAMWSRRT